MNHRNYMTAGLALTVFVALVPAYAADPLSAGQKGLYEGVTNNIIRAAEKMPEANYSFKPSPDVRSFGQLVGHLADYQYAFCSPAAGEKPPVSGIEDSKTSKADLVQALKDGYAYCDKIYSGMTDSKLSENASVEGRSRLVLSVLTLTIAHNNEHYGNMVTYLRIKGIVPPSSERRPPAPTK
ncbi:MAG TPA: DinB family protein [Bryobacteraceae bacterium]|nr:DinB family protein [Bryobacteraceae bacterium]